MFAATLAVLAACTGAPERTAAPPPGATAPAATAGALYVAPDGDDEAAGTEAEPWRTLGRALAALGPGDELFVRGGVYRERITDVALRPGRPDEPVLVSAYPGERPVVRGLLWLRSPSYWTFDGIDVTWDDEVGERDDHLVKIIDGVGWTWADSEIWGARSFAGLLVAGDVRGEPADWTVTGNCIHDTVPSNGENEDHNLYVGDMDDAGPGLVERNVFFGAPNGHNVKLGGADVSGGPTGVVVRYNTLYDAAVPLTISGRTTDVVVERNLIGEAGRGFLVRGFELTGEGNRLEDNVGFGADRFFAEDSGDLDAGGNLFVDPDFDATGTCDAFNPRSAEAGAYGRYAPAGS